MKKGILVLSIILSGAMASYSKGIKNNFTKENTITQAVIRNTNFSDTITKVVINDAFVTQVLNRDLTVPNVLRAYHAVNTYVKLIPNKNKAKAKDTLITITKGKTVYTFFKTGSGNTLTSANIENNSISTAGISVGISKDKFEKIIAAPHVSDVVIIEDTERSHRFIYTFNGDKLATIVYESPYHNY